MSAIPTFKVVRYGPNTYFLGGELDIASAPLLKETIAPSLERSGSILLDLAAVTFIDSMGVHAIADAGRVLGSGGCLFVHSPQRSVARVLEIVGLDAVPNIHVDACASDGFPTEFLDWRTPDDIAADFRELRALATR